MSPKSLPISVRVSPEIVEFISELELQEAITPSDKIRALIKEAKDHREKAEDVTAISHDFRTTLQDLFLTLRERELEEKVHSELFVFLNDWLADLTSYLMVGHQEESLADFERGVVERLFRMMSMILRMNISTPLCYNPRVLDDYMGPITEFVRLINNRVKGAKANV